jgi:hypothetical protein
MPLSTAKHSSYLTYTHIPVILVRAAILVPYRNLELMIIASPACDALSQSEIVVPVKNKAGAVVGVLDLDSTVKGTFDEVDKLGLERIAEALRI